MKLRIGAGEGMGATAEARWRRFMPAVEEIIGLLLIFARLIAPLEVDATLKPIDAISDDFSQTKIGSRFVDARPNCVCECSLL